MQSPLTRADLLAILRANVDEAWLQGILEDEASAQLLNANLDVLARVSLSGQRICDAGLISLAPGGSPGSTTIVMRRTITANSGTVPKGYVFRDSRGVQYVLTIDIAVAIGQATVVLPVQTLRETELVNTVDDPFAGTAQGSQAIVDPTGATILDSSATSILIAPDGTGGIDGHTLGYISADPVDGGTTDILSMHGDERGQLRQAGESTENYRMRVRNIPDAVTPIAIMDAVQGVATHGKLPPFTMYETIDDGATPALKATLPLKTIDSIYGGTGAAGPGWTADLAGDYCDDGLQVDGTPFRFRELLSLREARAYFALASNAVLHEPDSSVFYVDDGFCDDTVFGFPDIAFNVTLLAGLLAIIEEVNRKRAGGVQFDEVILGIDTKIVVGQPTSSNVAAFVGAVVAPLGKLWHYVDGFAGHTPGKSLGLVAGVPVPNHRVKFTFEDATTITTTPYAGSDSERISRAKLAALGVVKRVTRIDVYTQSDGIVNVISIGTFRVIEVAA